VGKDRESIMMKEGQTMREGEREREKESEIKVNDSVLVRKIRKGKEKN
jgi:hypothetical protein